MASVIEAAGLTRRFGSDPSAPVGIDNVSIQIRDDELLVLLGRSGSGKTTLLSLLGGLDTPSEGRVTVAGHDLAELSNEELEVFLQATVGWIFQTSGLLPLLTAEENVGLPLRAMGRPVAEARKQAHEALRVVGLYDRRDHLGSELSGGEQQRVAVARAIAKEPRVLLADEPTSQLDGETGTTILKLLREVANSGTCVVVATHDQSVAEYADRVLWLEDGRLTAPASVGPP